MKSKRKKTINNKRSNKQSKRSNKRSNKRNNKQSNKRTVKNVKRKYSIKNARMVSEKRYNELLNKKRLTQKEKKELDRALFVKYCKCIKKIKYSSAYSPGVEYPICMSTIYNKRDKKAPKGVDCFNFRAKYPSNTSVTAANQKTNAAPKNAHE